MDNRIEQSAIDALAELLPRVRRAVITCHLSPDGDAMGSSLGLCGVLRSMGKEAWVISPDTPPKYLMFLHGAQDILAYSRYELRAKRLMEEADVVFCLDYNDPGRIDRVAPAMLASPGVKVMIDHHLFPSDFPAIRISHPEVSSTSMLVYTVLCRLGLHSELTPEVAQCLYTGMMTDTGNFSYNSNDPNIYDAIADLVRCGIDKDWIYKKVYFNNTPDRLRLNGFAMADRFVTFPDHRAALITLTRDELNHYHYQKGDTEDLVNRPLTVPEITYSFFLREEAEYIKVSSRSKGSFPVNKMCEDHFNGGGHLNAAGGEFYGTMEQAVERLKEIMPSYDQYLD